MQIDNRFAICFDNFMGRGEVLVDTTVADSPWATVVMVVYNAGELLFHTLKSLENQIDRDFEVVIIDDGSTDITQEVLRQQYRIRMLAVHNPERLGQPRSLQMAVEHARGEVILRQQLAEEALAPRILKQRECFDLDPEVVLALGDYETVQKNGTHVAFIRLPRTSEQLAQTLRWKNVLIPGCIAFKKAAYTRIGGYDLRMQWAADYDLVTRLLRLGPVRITSEVLCRRCEDDIREEDRVMEHAYMSYTWLGKPCYSDDIITSRSNAWRQHWKALANVRGWNDESALENLAEAKRCAPENYWTAYLMASIWARRGLHHKAEMEFQRILQEGPTDFHAGAFFHLAKIALSQTRLADTASYLDKCLKLEPNHKRAALIRNQIQHRLYHLSKESCPEATEKKTERTPTRQWKEHVIIGYPLITRIPVIQKNTNVLCMGSCFSIFLREALADRGLSIYPRLPSNMPLPLSWYNPYSMLQEAQLAFGEVLRKTDDIWCTVKKDRWMDPYRSFIRADSKEKLQNMIRIYDQQMTEAFIRTNCFILIMGHIEAWRLPSGMWSCLEPQHPYEASAELHVMSVDDCYESMNQLIGLIWRHNPSADIILALSPGPLNKSFQEGVDVGIANCESKSTLRVALSRICRDIPKIFYIPFYELVTTIGPAAFRDDWRHIRPDLVEFAVETYFTFASVGIESIPIEAENISV